MEGTDLVVELIGCRGLCAALRPRRWPGCAVPPRPLCAADCLAGGLTLTCLGSKPSSRVITAHRMRAFLLAMATQAFCQPTRAVSCTSQREVGSSRLSARHHRGLGALDQQRAQVVVAALGDAPQTGLAAAGVLARHHAQPGAELVAALELLEVAHAGRQRRRTEFADADDLGRALGRRAGAHMLADLLVAPAQVLVELAPVIERALQHQPRRGAEFVAGILDHVGQHRAQHLRALAEDQAELRQHAADRLMQAVRSSFNPSRTRCRLITPCCSQVLTGTKRMLGRDAASQIAAASVASFLPLLPSMRYGVTKFAAISRASSPSARSLRAQWCALEHASIATRQPARQLRAPGEELIALERACHYAPARCIHRVDLDHLLGQVNPYPRTIGARVISLMGFPFSVSD